MAIEYEYDVKYVNELIKNKQVADLKAYMQEHGLTIKDGRITSTNIAYLKQRQNFWDLKQLIKKLQLNASYGALLQSSSTFYDFRFGASTTMSGRLVVKHLTSEANRLLIDKYEVYKHCAAYNDTDSVYCTIDTDEFREQHPNFDYSKENLIKYADDIADKINISFPNYMINTFHCTKKGAELQKAGREVVASQGLFVSKKRYALLVFDHDGFRQDLHGSIGELKIMGLQIKRNDTPKIVREMLLKLIETLLLGGTEKDLKKIINDFYKNQWITQKPWSKGTPKPINKLAVYEDMIKNGQDGCIGKKATIPGQIKAALNFNKLIDYYKDTTTKKLAEGDKVYVCRLTPNNFLNMDCVAISVELGDGAIPQWFKELPFDFNKTNDIIDKTIDSIFSVLKWNLSIKTIIEEEKQNKRMNNLGIDFD